MVTEYSADASTDAVPSGASFGAMSSPEKSSKQRTVPMEVLGLEFSRTGTESLKIALETLGYEPWLLRFGQSRAVGYVDRGNQGKISWRGYPIQTGGMGHPSGRLPRESSIQ